MASSAVLSPLGILAGSGGLPRQLIEHCASIARPVFVIAFKGETEPALVEAVPHVWVSIGEVGKTIKSLKAVSVEEVVLAGRIRRPSFSTLKVDVEGVKLIAKIISKRSQGDNTLFAIITQHLESKGFVLTSVDTICPEVLAPVGVLGYVQPDKEAEADIAYGIQVAKLVGEADVGQAVIVQQGIIIGIEAIEGTDELIRRCAPLARKGKAGILIKVKKPAQDTRVDLPTIGVYTVEHAHAHGLRGIAVEAGGAIIVERAATIARADELGMFVVGCGWEKG